MDEQAIYLITHFAADGKETERLISAASRHKAELHVIRTNKASAGDVARVLGKGGNVEQSTE